MSASFLHVFLQKLSDQVKIGGRDISEGINEALDYRPRFTLDLKFLKIPVTDAIFAIFVSVLALIFLAFIFRRNLTRRPGRRQALLEKLVEALLNLCRQSGLNEQQSRIVLPYVGALALYIIFSSLVSVIKLKPAPANPAFPVTLALFTILVVIIMGIRFVGLKGFWYSIINPMPALLPFNLLDYIIKPISLAFRLFGNIFGAFILIEFISLVMPLIIPSLFGLWFDVADGIIQGVVFSYLTITYIGEIVEKAEATKELLAEKAEAKHKKTVKE